MARNGLWRRVGALPLEVPSLRPEDVVSSSDQREGNDRSRQGYYPPEYTSILPLLYACRLDEEQVGQDGLPAWPDVDFVGLTRTNFAPVAEVMAGDLNSNRAIRPVHHHVRDSESPSSTTAAAGSSPAECTE